MKKSLWLNALGFVLHGFILNPSAIAEDTISRQIIQRHLSYYLADQKEVLHGPYLESVGERLLLKGDYVDGQKEGRWEGFHENGIPASEQFFKAGQPDGLYRSWWPSGNLQCKVTYSEGQKSGLEEQWFDNGQRQRYIQWEKGQQNGPMQEWFPSGQEHVRCMYSAGKKEGLLQEWNLAGEITREELYQNDILIKLLMAKEKYNDGNPKENYEYYLDDLKQEVRHGAYKKYFPNGEIWIECNYVHGRIDGLWQYGKLEGLECRQENYKLGVKHGTFKWYHEGKVIREEMWKDGILVSQKRN